MTRMSFLRMKRVNAQSGQVLPVSLFGTALLVLTMLAVFNTSQLSSKKQRLNNAADAAAYSAAIFQARSLNSIAYTNRAMIANQVFIGQMVSIENYLSFWEIKSRNLSTIPYVNLVAGPINQAINSIQSGFTAFTATAITGTTIVNRALSAHQDLVALTGGAQIPLIVDRVLDANDPDIEITLPHGAIWLADSATRWNGYFDKKDTSDDLIAKARMINASRDSFTRNRSYSPRIFWTPANTYYLQKEGNTTLNWEVNGNSTNFRWDALDILYVKRDKRFGGNRNAGSIAWSRRSVSEDGRKYECLQPGCDGARQRRPTMRLARLDENESIPANYRLQSYYELAEDVGYDPRFPIAVSVQYENNDIATSTNVTKLGSNSAQVDSTDELSPGLFYQETNTLNDNIEAVSKAEVYFRRPVDRLNRHQFGAYDNKDEFANIWNPYWSARLVEATEERAAARALKGL